MRQGCMMEGYDKRTNGVALRWCIRVVLDSTNLCQEQYFVTHCDEMLTVYGTRRTNTGIVRRRIGSIEDECAAGLFICIDGTPVKRSGANVPSRF